MCLRVCKGVRTPPNRQTSPFRAGQRPAVCFLLLYFTPRLFLPLLVLRGVSALYRQTPTLFCSLPSSQTGLSIERERERREEEEVSCLDKRTPRAGCGGSLPSGCVGLALLHRHTYTTQRGRAKSPFLTHTLILQPHTLSSSSRFSTHCPPLTSSLWLHPALPRS